MASPLTTYRTLPPPFPSPVCREVWVCEERSFGFLRWKSCRFLLELKERCRFELPDGSVVEVPPVWDGEPVRWDGASVPRLFRWFADRIGLSLLATLWHDMCFRFDGAIPMEWFERGGRQCYSRRECNDMFEALMERQGVPRVKRRLSGQMVRLFSRRF